MELKLIVQQAEVGKLMKVFNSPQFSSIGYGFESSESDEKLVIVKSDNEDESAELLEVLMEEFDEIKIEETISCGPGKKPVKGVIIFSNGTVAVYDDENNLIPELQGLWKDKYKEILELITESTTFNDSRPNQ